MKEGRKPEYPRKPLTKSFRKCHILKPENSSPKPDSNPHSSIGGRLGKQKPLHPVSPILYTLVYKDPNYVHVIFGATCGVTVNTSAFLACHQCYCVGSKSRLGFESSGFSMWHFLKLIARGFLQVLRCPPLLHRSNGSANKIKLK